MQSRVQRPTAVMMMYGAVSMENDGTTESTQPTTCVPYPHLTAHQWLVQCDLPYRVEYVHQLAVQNQNLQQSSSWPHDGLGYPCILPPLLGTPQSSDAMVEPGNVPSGDEGRSAQFPPQYRDDQSRLLVQVLDAIKDQLKRSEELITMLREERRNHEAPLEMAARCTAATCEGREVQPVTGQDEVRNKTDWS